MLRRKRISIDALRFYAFSRANRGDRIGSSLMSFARGFSQRVRRASFMRRRLARFAPR